MHTYMKIKVISSPCTSEEEINKGSEYHTSTDDNELTPHKKEKKNKYYVSTNKCDNEPASRKKTNNLFKHQDKV